MPKLPYTKHPSGFPVRVDTAFAPATYADRPSGFVEVDLVSHSGSDASGELIYSLNLTDIKTAGRTSHRMPRGKRPTVTSATEK
jgi:hypothetical protein